MKKKIILITFMIAALLVGCVQSPAPSDGGGNTQAEVPTNTPVPPTPTPVPPTPTPIPDLKAILTTGGFESIDPLLPVGMKLGDLLEIKDSASFGKSNTNEFVHAVVFPLPTEVELAGFSLELANPNFTLMAIVTALNGFGIDAKTDLTNPSAVGEMSKGVTFITKIADQNVRADVVMFKEGTNGAIVVVLRPDGAAPSVDAWQVAQKLDEKIKTGK